MSTYVYYNPKTNTIERKQPVQTNAFQMPYLLNIQPQDLNYAMKNTSDIRSYPSFVSYPPNYDSERPNKENISNNREPETRASYPQNTHNNSKPSKEFVMMEDFNENDIERTQTYKPTRDQNRSIQQSRTQEFRRSSPQDDRAIRPTPIHEEEAREDFNMMRPEDLMLKYKPEDYSINERILNAKFVREEQLKTRKFVLDRIGEDIKVMENRANAIEKDIQQNEKETKSLEAKTQQIWQEFERKKFELKAKEIMDRIDDAVDADKEAEVDEHKYDDFYNENRALYDEIDKVLEEGGEEEIYYVEEPDRSKRQPAKQKTSRHVPVRASSSGVRNTSGYGRSTYSGFKYTETGRLSNNRSNNQGYKNYGHSSVNSKSKKGLDGIFGQKSAMRPATAGVKGVLKRPIGSVTNQSSGGYKNQVTFKNPQRVEDALNKAKAITNLY